MVVGFLIFHKTALQDTRIQSQLNAIVRYIVDFDEKQVRAR